MSPDDHGSDPPRPGLLTHRRFADKCGVATKTIDRWTEAGILPPPVRINTRKYWPDTVAPRADKTDD
jgi:predicted DNA-binding transcriptional regulator AlpA